MLRESSLLMLVHAATRTQKLASEFTQIKFLERRSHAQGGRVGGYTRPAGRGRHTREGAISPPLGGRAGLGAYPQPIRTLFGRGPVRKLPCPCENLLIGP